jgi:dTDP-glucose 4,6-dehydratase
MRLLVTGGCGFIGSAVVRQALDRGHQVVNLDALTYAANPANLDAVAGHPRYRFVHADIRDRAALDSVFSSSAFDTVLHLAAESHVDRSIDGPGAFLATNTVGTSVLLEAARTDWERRQRPSGFRFVGVSTDEVFGSCAVGRFDETSPYAPTNPYAASKAAADHLVRAWHHTFGLPTLVTHGTNTYGPFHFPEKLVPVVLLRALAGEPIPLYGDGSNVRDWLYVEDHAHALLDVAEQGQPGRSYAISAGNLLSNLELVRQICTALDHQRPLGAPHARLLTFVPDRPGHDQRYALDASRITAELGWHPTVSLAEGVARTVAWYLTHEDWWRPLLQRHSLEDRLGNA